MKKYRVNDKMREDIINRIRKRLKEQKEIEFAYLHGSFAEGKEFQDIDIAVFINNKIKDYLEYEYLLKINLEKLLPYPLDLNILNQTSTSFCYGVIKNGLLLFERDENKRVEFETSTIREFVDFLPFRRRYLREALNLEI